MGADKEQIEDMYRDGITYSQIAKKFGISRQRVAQIIFPDRRLYRALQQRAQLRCEECEVYVEHGHAHHLKPNPDGDVTTLENLAYLCPSCHRKTHRSTEKVQSYSTEEVDDPYTLCRRGHPRTGNNVIIRKRGDKTIIECRQCANDGLQARRDAKKKVGK
jgi:hypothetical protein